MFINSKNDGCVCTGLIWITCFSFHSKVIFADFIRNFLKIFSHMKNEEERRKQARTTNNKKICPFECLIAHNHFIELNLVHCFVPNWWMGKKQTKQEKEKILRQGVCVCDTMLPILSPKKTRFCLPKILCNFLCIVFKNILIFQANEKKNN